MPHSDPSGADRPSHNAGGEMESRCITLSAGENHSLDIGSCQLLARADCSIYGLRYRARRLQYPSSSVPLNLVSPLQLKPIHTHRYPSRTMVEHVRSSRINIHIDV